MLALVSEQYNYDTSSASLQYLNPSSLEKIKENSVEKLLDVIIGTTFLIHTCKDN